MKRQKSMIRILTNRSFKANKTRNLVAIFAIVLTTVMFASLFVLSQSMVENLRNMNFQQAGYNSHLSSGIMTDADMEKITTHEAVRDFGKSIVVGIAENKELTGRQVEIRYGDENYARSSFSYPTEGTMPVRENEIALDTITLDKMGLSYELGQEITLQWRKDLNGEEITTSTFTLSGYWDENSAAMASMAWVSEAFVQSQCAGINQVEQLANGQVLGTVMLHRQIKGFLLFLTLFALLFVGTATVLTIYQVNDAEVLWLKHDEAVSSSLLEQGVPKEVIAVAFTNTDISEDGRSLLFADSGGMPV